MDDASANEVLDEGLTRLAATGPEFRGGLSNHGPMAGEAMVRLGRADAIEGWLDGYLEKLDDPPAPSDRITDQTWREALGAINRVADWDRYFRAQLAEEPWRDVLARWWPRLLPGLAAAATHGVIRTSHAARSLAAAEEVGADTAGRTGELGRGLAYWAARYLELPGRARTERPAGPGRRGQRAAGRGRQPATRPDLRDPQGGVWPTQPGFAAAVGALRGPTGRARRPGRAGPRVRPGLPGVRAQRPIALLHSVTAPVAARSVLPLLPAEAGAPHLRRPLAGRRRALRRLHRRDDPRAAPGRAAPSADELADRAVATGDEHAIKLTEACLRLDAVTPDPLLRHAAARAAELLG